MSNIVPNDYIWPMRVISFFKDDYDISLWRG